MFRSVAFHLNFNGFQINPILSSKKGLARSQPFSIANLCSFRSAVQLQNLIGFLELHHIDLLDRLVNGHSAPVHNAGEDE